MNTYKCSKCKKDSVINANEDKLSIPCCDGDKLIEHNRTGLKANPVKAFNVDPSNSPSKLDVKATGVGGKPANIVPPAEKK